jgi:hypothetical protein
VFKGSHGPLALRRVGIHLHGGEFDALELDRADHRHGQVVALQLVEVSLLEAPAHHDDPLRPGDLELEVGVVGIAMSFA